MTREEAIAAGMEVHEIQHSMKRRTPWHDYSRKGTYMLTLVVRGRIALLGTLKGGLEGEVAPFVEYSVLGSTILQEEQKKIHRYYPQVEVWKLCVMPDHLHMIVRINEDMGEGKHLGKVVAGFKSGCNHAYWKVFNMNEPPRQGLFEDGYCDKILMHDGQLDNWKRYLDDNPRRLMMKLGTMCGKPPHSARLALLRSLSSIFASIMGMIFRRYVEKSRADGCSTRYVRPNFLLPSSMPTVFCLKRRR